MFRMIILATVSQVITILSPIDIMMYMEIVALHLLCADVDVIYYPHMLIGKVWIMRLLFLCFVYVFCLFVCLYGYEFLCR